MSDFSQTRSEYLKIMMGERKNALAPYRPEQMNDLGDTSFDVASLSDDDIESALKQMKGTQYEGSDVFKSLETERESRGEKGAEEKPWWQQVGDFFTNIGTSIMEGIFTVADEIKDFALGFAGGLYGGGWFGAKNDFTDWVANAITDDSWIDYATEALGKVQPPITMLSHIGDSDYWNNYWTFDLNEIKQKQNRMYQGQEGVRTVGNFIGEIIPSLALAYASGGVSLGVQAAAQAGLGFAKGMGEAQSRALSEGASFQESAGYGAVKGAISSALAGGLTYAGGTFASRSADSLISKVGNKVGDAILTKTGNASLSAFANHAITFVIRVAGDAGEAAVLTAIEPAFQQIYKENAWYNAYGTDENRKAYGEQIKKAALTGAAFSALTNIVRDVVQVYKAGGRENYMKQYEENAYQRIPENEVLKSFSRADRRMAKQGAKEWQSIQDEINNVQSQYDSMKAKGVPESELELFVGKSKEALSKRVDAFTNQYGDLFKKLSAKAHPDVTGISDNTALNQARTQEFEKLSSMTTKGMKEQLRSLFDGKQGVSALIEYTKGAEPVETVKEADEVVAKPKNFEQVRSVLAAATNGRDKVPSVIMLPFKATNGIRLTIESLNPSQLRGLAYLGGMDLKKNEHGAFIADLGDGKSIAILPDKSAGEIIPTESADDWSALTKTVEIVQSNKPSETTKIIPFSQSKASSKLIEAAADSTKPTVTRLKTVHDAFLTAISETVESGTKFHLGSSDYRETHAELNLARPKDRAVAIENMMTRLGNTDLWIPTDESGEEPVFDKIKLRDIMTPEQEDEAKSIMLSIINGKAEMSKLTKWARSLKVGKAKLHQLKKLTSIKRKIKNAEKDYFGGPDVPKTELSVYSLLFEGVDVPFTAKSATAFVNNILAHYSDEAIGAGLKELGMTYNPLIREYAESLKGMIVEKRPLSLEAQSTADDLLTLINEELKQIGGKVHERNVSIAREGIVLAQGTRNRLPNTKVRKAIRDIDYATRSPATIIETELGYDHPLAIHIREGGQDCSNAEVKERTRFHNLAKSIAEENGIKDTTKALAKKIEWKGRQITVAEGLSVISLFNSYGEDDFTKSGIVFTDKNGNDTEKISVTVNDIAELKSILGDNIVKFQQAMARDFWNGEARDYADDRMHKNSGVHLKAVEGEYFPGSRVGMKEPDIKVSHSGSIDPNTWGLSFFKERTSSRLPFRIIPYDKVVGNHVSKLVTWGEWAPWYKKLRVMENTRVFGTTLTNQMRNKVGSDSWDKLMDFVHRTALGIGYDNKITSFGGIFDRTFGRLQKAAMMDLFTQIKTLGSMATLYQQFGLATALKGEVQYVKNGMVGGDARAKQVIESLSPVLKERFKSNEAFSSNVMGVKMHKVDKALTSVVRTLDMHIHVGKAWAMSQVKAMEEGYGDPWTEKNNKRAVRILEEASNRTQPTTQKFNVGMYRAGANGVIVKRLFGMFASMPQNIYQGLIDVTAGWVKEGQRIKDYEKRIEEIDQRVEELEAERSNIEERLESADTDEEYKKAEEALKKNSYSKEENAKSKTDLEEALRKTRARHNKKTYVSKVLGFLAGIVGSGLVLTFIASLKKKTYGTEEWSDWNAEKLTHEAVWQSFVNWIPYVSTFANAFKNNTDITVFSMQTVNDVVDLAQSIIKAIQTGDGGRITGSTFKLLLEVGQMFGIPAKSMWKLVNGLWYNVNHASNIKARNWLGMYSNNSLSSSFKNAVGRNDMSSAAELLGVSYSLYKTGNVERETLVEISKLYRDGFNPIARNVPDYYTDSDGAKVYLSDDQRITFSKTYSEANKVVIRLIRSAQYGKADSETKAKHIKKVYDLYYEFARYKSTGIDPESRLGKLLAYTGGDYDIANTLLLIQQNAELMDTKRLTKKEQAMRLVNQQSMTKVQKLLALYLMGYGVNSENKKLVQKYLVSLGFTKKQAEDFLPSSK